MDKTMIISFLPIRYTVNMNNQPQFTGFIKMTITEKVFNL